MLAIFLDAYWCTDWFDAADGISALVAKSRNCLASDFAYLIQLWPLAAQLRLFISI